MSSKNTPQADEQILRLIYRNPCPYVKKLLQLEGNNIDNVIAKIANPKNCARVGARQCADQFALCLGITPADFMKRWLAMR